MELRTNKVQLGDLAEDTVSGFKGVVVAITFWLHGCARVTLQPQKLTKDGKVHENHCFDELQLKVLKTRKAFEGNRGTGGPRPDILSKAATGGR